MVCLLMPLGLRFGFKSTILRPIRIDGGKNIRIGSGSLISRGTWLYAVPQEYEKSRLRIGSNCAIGSNNHFVAIRSIVIEDNVLTANNVYISDNSHQYEDISKPIIEQEAKFLRKVVIGSGSWLGENVCVIGASIGRNSVVGANSVVTRDVPDFCVAVGAPAVIIKHSDHVNARWVQGSPACELKAQK